MCGIMGMTASINVLPVVVAGLGALEYRGYDSVGIVWPEKGQLKRIRTAGRVAGLTAAIAAGAGATTALGHTRWATHGQPNEANAHPHFDETGSIAIVHNGIIDNYAALRKSLEEQGVKFTSETDSEVIAQLIARHYQGNLLAAVEEVLPMLQGTYALGVMAKAEPDILVGARLGSPLVVGLGQGFHMLASDVVPFLAHTKQAAFLEDGQVALISKDQCLVYENGQETPLKITDIEWSAQDATLEGYQHYMLKEIHEQPQMLNALIHSRLYVPRQGMPQVAVEAGDFSDEQLRKVKRIVFLSHGTAYYAAMIGRLLIERVARIPCYAEYAADFRYRNPILEPGTLFVPVTQSGETSDTLHALRLVKQAGYPSLALVNVAGSSIAREADSVFALRAGPEIGVASTKVFTNMIAALYILALRLAIIHNHEPMDEVRRRANDLLKVGDRVRSVLAQAEDIKRIALHYQRKEHFLFLGRGTGWPLAMEGALKMKEVSYIHAEGMNAAEIKHGPLALVDDQMPVLFITLKGERYDRLLANMTEVKARGGRIVAIISHDDNEIPPFADETIAILDDCGVMNAILCAIPLQLMAYYVAVARGTDVDKPKNLAKSVTVE